MEYESSSRVVRGLSIATIVLSAIGIVLALGLGACSSSVVGMVEKEVVEPVASEPFDYDGYLDEIDDAAEELTGATLSEFGSLLAYCDATDIHRLGKAVAEGNQARIEHVIDNIAKEAGVSIDSALMARSFMQMGAEDAREFGLALQQVTEEDLLDMVLVFSGAQDLLKPDGSSADDPTVGEIGTAVSGIIMLLIWIFVVLDIIGCAVTIVAAVLAMRNCDNPNKLSGAFVWSIVGAVIALLGCRIITMVLLIINCIYIHKVRAFRTLPAAAAAAAQENPVPPFASAAEPAAAPQPPAAEQPAAGAAPVPPQE
ncbi:MAG: hypothetical protein ACI36V_03960 [Coriobacteriales bacterium]